MRHILERIAHRPWPLPAGRWAMAQTWHDLLFAHWPLPADRVRPAVPRALELDLFDGCAWLGVIPFRMTGIHVRGMPPLPGVSAFAELNVRTYVARESKPGVYFFSLDAGSRIAVEAARRWYHLPYFHATMSCRNSEGWVEYRCRRFERPAVSHQLSAVSTSEAGYSTGQAGAAAEFVGKYRPVGEGFHARPGTLEHFLTERYCLYTTDACGGLCRGEIHHAPWPLEPAEAEIETNTMAEAAGFRLPETQPVCFFARRLEVALWGLQRL